MSDDLAMTARRYYRALKALHTAEHEAGHLLSLDEPQDRERFEAIRRAQAWALDGLLKAAATADWRPRIEPPPSEWTNEPLAWTRNVLKAFGPYVAPRRRGAGE